MRGRRCVGHCAGEIDAETFSCAGALELEIEKESVRELMNKLCGEEPKCNPTWGKRTYIPLRFECFQVHKRVGNALVAEIGFVLLQEPSAELGVFIFGNGVLDIGLLETLECDDDAVDFGKRVVEVSLS